MLVKEPTIDATLPEENAESPWASLNRKYASSDETNDASGPKPSILENIMRDISLDERARENSFTSSMCLSVSYQSTKYKHHFVLECSHREYKGKRPICHAYPLKENRSGLPPTKNLLDPSTLNEGSTSLVVST